MFGFGDKKARLEKKYQSLLQQSYELSTQDRQKSDARLAEAEKIRKELEQLDAET